MSSTRKTLEPWGARLRSLSSLTHRLEGRPHDSIPEKLLSTVQALHAVLFGPDTGDVYWEQTVLPPLQRITEMMVKNGPESVPQEVRLLIKRADHLLEKPGPRLADLKPARLQLPAFKELRLVQVGCGGSGSWLAPHVARAARMVQEEQYCVDILFQLSAVQGALEQVQKLLVGRHIESCVADAMRSGRPRERQKKIDELLAVFSRFGSR